CASVVSFCASLLIFFFFFFSSRRRHTRFSRDWSSDVCSSDLPEGDPVNARGSRFGCPWLYFYCYCLCHLSAQAGHQLPRFVLLRSEERRVGKECRSRWSAYQ